jgi:hypothetical protein
VDTSGSARARSLHAVGGCMQCCIACGRRPRRRAPRRRSRQHACDEQSVVY